MRRVNGALDPLILSLPSGGEVLPVFAEEATAKRYLRSALPGAGWHVREFPEGELSSMLMTLCRGVSGVLLDPGPAGREANAAFVHREGFLSSCLEGTSDDHPQQRAREAAFASVRGD
ncbi:hypothetical protein GBA65_07500 [Rubrobacter marinus]|uniref:SseB protein N-terminal domain-containing protein n=1 Tax=Rubrobacter marinus TaxID=2653852 RepID=A0A6G8PW28_9ACTN|nr:hypothetical protein [Rubrobacter marinus]QIN78393.1 hypothetical protein GBA65_07500 [Rubrobacter marinus]